MLSTPFPLPFVSSTLLLFRGDGDIWFRCDLRAGLFERCYEVEVAERELPALAQVRSELVSRDRAVGDLLRAIDGEYLFFGHPLEKVAKAEHCDLMSDDQDALAPVVARDRINDAAQAQDHIAPAFAAGRAMIELAERCTGL